MLYYSRLPILLARGVSSASKGVERNRRTLARRARWRDDKFVIGNLYNWHGGSSAYPPLGTNEFMANVPPSVAVRLSICLAAFARGKKITAAREWWLENGSSRNSADSAVIVRRILLYMYSYIRSLQFLTSVISRILFWYFLKNYLTQFIRRKN